MSRASGSVMLPGPKWGMLPGPVRMASRIWVGVARCRLGAYAPSARASPAPVMVWQAAQLRVKRVLPFSRLASLRLHDGDADTFAGGQRLHEGGDLEGLEAVEPGRLAGGLHVGVRERHAPGGHPEVDRAGSQSLQVGRPTAALGRRSVAGRAVGGEQRLPRGHERPGQGHVVDPRAGRGRQTRTAPRCSLRSWPGRPTAGSEAGSSITGR